MASTLIGVVYNIADSIVRRIIVPDDDSELNLPSHVQDGERMLVLPQSSYTIPLRPEDIASIVQTVNSAATTTTG
jgi:hypothetical protein